MKERLYKYQGAGNDFIIIDNRDGHIKDGDLAAGGKLDVTELCNRHYGIGSDGLMLLEEPTSRSADCCFRMRFFNPDGSGGMMCGNGGRCIVAFAEHCGILPSDGDKYVFEAPDGLHEAYIVQTDENKAADDRIGGLLTRRQIRLKMRDVDECRRVKIEHLSADGKPEIVEGVFMDTGTRHFVTFVENVDECNVVADGRALRYDKVFAPKGANINFVESGCFDRGTVGASSKTAADSNAIKVRTYEKGVEDETEACGTGITASAIASCIYGIPPFHIDGNGVYHYKVLARRETLEVEFKPEFRKDADNGKGIISPIASSVWLSGPAVKVAEIIYEQSDNSIDNNL